MTDAIFGTMVRAPLASMKEIAARMASNDRVHDYVTHKAAGV